MGMVADSFVYSFNFQAIQLAHFPDLSRIPSNRQLNHIGIVPFPGNIPFHPFFRLLLRVFSGEHSLDFDLAEILDVQKRICCIHLYPYPVTIPQQMYLSKFVSLSFYICLPFTTQSVRLCVFVTSFRCLRIKGNVRQSDTDTIIHHNSS